MCECEDIRMETVHAMMEITPFLNKMFAVAVKSLEDDLPISQITAMGVLVRVKSSNMTQMARMMRVSNQQLTKIIDGLVDKKLVERGHAPDSRRVILVRLTPQGEAYITDCFKKMVESVMPSFDKYDDEEIRILHHSFQEIVSVLKKKGLGHHG